MAFHSMLDGRVVKGSSAAGYGLEDILNTSGFVGLALLEMLSFGVTF